MRTRSSAHWRMSGEPIPAVRSRAAERFPGERNAPGVVTGAASGHKTTSIQTGAEGQRHSRAVSLLAIHYGAAADSAPSCSRSSAHSKRDSVGFGDVVTPTLSEPTPRSSTHPQRGCCETVVGTGLGSSPPRTPASRCTLTTWTASIAQRTSVMWTHGTPVAE